MKQVFGLLLFIILPTVQPLCAYHRMVVLITSYNNASWLGKNLDETFAQKYPAEYFRVIYVDDCSTDGTGDLVDRYKEEHNLGDRLIIVHNDRRMLKAHNLYYAGHMCEPGEIIVELDGDDWLNGHEVLALLDDLYEKQDIWVTYGNLIDWPSGRVETCIVYVPQSYIDRNAYREFDAGNIWAGLRSYYAWLFQKIDVNDFLIDSARSRMIFLPMSVDAAIMFPMLEMAGGRHLCITKPLLVHNTATPFNDHKVNVQLQFQLAKMIRGRSRYAKLDQSEALHLKSADAITAAYTKVKSSNIYPNKSGEQDSCGSHCNRGGYKRTRHR